MHGPEVKTYTETRTPTQIVEDNLRRSGAHRFLNIAKENLEIRCIPGDIEIWERTGIGVLGDPIAEVTLDWRVAGEVGVRNVQVVSRLSTYTTRAIQVLVSSKTGLIPLEETEFYREFIRKRKEKSALTLLDKIALGRRVAEVPDVGVQVQRRIK